MPPDKRWRKEAHELWASKSISACRAVALELQSDVVLDFKDRKNLFTLMALDLRSQNFPVDTVTADGNKSGSADVDAVRLSNAIASPSVTLSVKRDEGNENRLWVQAKGGRGDEGGHGVVHDPTTTGNLASVPSATHAYMLEFLLEEEHDITTHPYDNFRYALRFIVPFAYPHTAPFVCFVKTTFLLERPRPAVQTVIPYHPNICPSTGSICMDLLNAGSLWSPVLTLLTTKLAITSLLQTPNEDHGLNGYAIRLYRELVVNAGKRQFFSRDGIAGRTRTPAIISTEREQDNSEPVTPGVYFDQQLHDQLLEQDKGENFDFPDAKSVEARQEVENQLQKVHNTFLRFERFDWKRCDLETLANWGPVLYREWVRAKMLQENPQATRSRKGLSAEFLTPEVDRAGVFVRYDEAAAVTPAAPARVNAAGFSAIGGASGEIRAEPRDVVAVEQPHLSQGSVLTQRRGARQGGAANENSTGEVLQDARLTEQEGLQKSPSAAPPRPKLFEKTYFQEFQRQSRKFYASVPAPLKLVAGFLVFLIVYGRVEKMLARVNFSTEEPSPSAKHHQKHRASSAELLNHQLRGLEQNSWMVNLLR
ncbi:unnamed protein product [Amoebophrya sp. A120]|nr:unnamed protein product [Amoebophrya sp. A120]|eukprot:GSA120T00011845001.1